jgi:sugar lactone lactonase YvrE
MRARAAVLAATFLVAGSSAVLAQGPGDPTTVFADGFDAACRMAFDSVGNLLVVNGGAGEIWRVDPSGGRTLFTDQIPDPRWVAFDAFGWLLVTSHTDSVVYRISPQGDLTEFVELAGGVGAVTGPDGSIWVGAVDTLFHFDAMGRRMEAIEIRETYGFGVRALYFAPTGELYMTGSGGLWKLVAGVPHNLLFDLPLRWAGIAFDTEGNGYWAHEAWDEADIDRVALVDLDGNWLNESWITQVVDGRIVKAATGSPLAAGWPVVGLRFSQIDEAAAADEVMGVPDLLPDPTRVFFDVIGNNDGSYDVGDFRAYLIAAGVVN